MACCTLNMLRHIMHDWHARRSGNPEMSTCMLKYRRKLQPDMRPAMLPATMRRFKRDTPSTRASRIAKRGPLQNLHARAALRRQTVPPVHPMRRCKTFQPPRTPSTIPHGQHHSLATSPAAGQSRAKLHGLSMNPACEPLSHANNIQIRPHPATPPRIRGSPQALHRLSSRSRRIA